MYHVNSVLYLDVLFCLVVINHVVDGNEEHRLVIPFRNRPRQKHPVCPREAVASVPEGGGAVGSWERVRQCKNVCHYYCYTFSSVCVYLYLSSTTYISPPLLFFIRKLH